MLAGCSSKSPTAPRSTWVLGRTRAVHTPPTADALTIFPAGVYSAPGVQRFSPVLLNLSLSLLRENLVSAPLCRWRNRGTESLKRLMQDHRTGKWPDLQACGAAALSLNDDALSLNDDATLLIPLM